MSASPRPRFDYRAAGRSLKDPPEERAVVIAGAGLVGLTLAIDLQLRGVDVLLLEKADTVSIGSRSICQAQRSLEIWSRLGIGEAIRDRGVTWTRGRVFHRDSELYSFNLQPSPGFKMPAFVNLQQYHVETLLHERYAEIGGELRVLNEFADLTPENDGVLLTVDTPDGPYRIHTQYFVSCEGVRSSARRQLGLRFEGEVFRDKFLIADVRMHANFPAERWFWFEPPFHDGDTALLHKQADDVWRIDLQLGQDAAEEIELQPKRVRQRIERMLGHGEFDFEWLSIYAFQSRCLSRLVHGRVIFAGDSAHQVSPFGARGGNGGIQDADNLAWKLAAVLENRSPVELLDTYDMERRAATAENILNSTRATRFMTPGSVASRVLRDQVLSLARDNERVRMLVNPGRLSVPAHYEDSALNSPDIDSWKSLVRPGSPPADAPIGIDGKSAHLIDKLGGNFTLLAGRKNRALDRRIRIDGQDVDVLVLDRDLSDQDGMLHERYDLDECGAILFRPDQHLAMRRRQFSPAMVSDGVRTALRKASPC